MFSKPAWRERLHQLKREEVEAAFAGVPSRTFSQALEIGAGDGYQSGLLKAYADSLVATDMNAARLVASQAPDVMYRVCDAEHIEDAFTVRSFDLVFSSSLLEHLPNLDKALNGLHTVMRDDGLAVHIIPTRFWKACHLALFPLDRLYLLWNKLRGTLPAAQVSVPSTTKSGNNMKLKASPKTVWDLFWPRPHGCFDSHLREWRAYGSAWWRKRFESAGFRIVCYRPGPITSGYGFGWSGLRSLLKALGIASVHIFVLAKKGLKSPNERFFQRPCAE